ncbi:hypothetical protein INR49_003363, partial [Caranx melampygus]
MPYNIWCDGCKNHIGMGTCRQIRRPATIDSERGRAGKRSAGTWLENEQILTTEREQKEKLETDAMYKLDHGGKDKEKLRKALPSLSEIQDPSLAGRTTSSSTARSARSSGYTEKKVLAEQEEKDN